MNESEIGFLYNIADFLVEGVGGLGGWDLGLFRFSCLVMVFRILFFFVFLFCFRLYRFYFKFGFLGGYYLVVENSGWWICFFVYGEEGYFLKILEVFLFYWVRWCEEFIEFIRDRGGISDDFDLSSVF